MTTTQTGGGNGAAPDGGSERKLPTRPGWWWGRTLAFGGGWGEWESVRLWASESPDSGLWCREFSCWADSEGVEWLAPIPGPAVCAALAGYAEALAACDSAPEGKRGRAILDRWVAEDALQNAIRAERDGGA